MRAPRQRPTPPRCDRAMLLIDVYVVDVTFAFVLLYSLTFQRHIGQPVEWETWFYTCAKQCKALQCFEELIMVNIIVLPSAFP